MFYIDPHIHMVSRTTDDYETLAKMGCVAVSEPAFWAGFDRGTAEGFRDYFHQLTEFEPTRASWSGIHSVFQVRLWRLVSMSAILTVPACPSGP